jgi:hypothetical protein
MGYAARHWIVSKIASDTLVPFNINFHCAAAGTEKASNNKKAMKNK